MASARLLPTFPGAWCRLGFLVLAGLCCLGCGRGREGTTDPVAKLRLEKVLELYLQHANDPRNQKHGPKDEKALKDLVQKLPDDQKEALKNNLKLESLDDLLVSPRDGKKFNVRYNMVVDPGGDTRALAWEEAGEDGKRFVALTVGYVQECDEQYFNELKNKK